MAYTVPLLGYPFEALEPYVDAVTMEIHHDRHHGAYVANLNKALEGHPELQGQSVEKLISHLLIIPEGIRTVVRNNGGGHANHTFFWTVISPDASPVPVGELASAITSQFLGLEEFKARFEAVGIAHFGSGWVWLVMGRSCKLEIISTSNQDSPISQGFSPILGLDVWEHAYYLKYQNRRADYVRAMWNVVNWDQAERYYLAARAS